MATLGRHHSVSYDPQRQHKGGWKQHNQICCTAVVSSCEKSHTLQYRQCQKGTIKFTTTTLASSQFRVLLKSHTRPRQSSSPGLSIHCTPTTVSSFFDRHVTLNGPRPPHLTADIAVPISPISRRLSSLSPSWACPRGSASACCCVACRASCRRVTGSGAAAR